MSALLSLLAPLLLALGLGLAAWRGVDGYAALLEGAKNGLRVLLALFPTLLLLFPAVALLRESGLPERIALLLTPLLERLGIPPQTAQLLLLRPFSGSAALAAASELIERAGADSLVGRCAAVMLGASETSFYVTAIYFSAAGVRDSRWTIPAALCADLACFVSAAWISRMLWGR